MSTKEKKADVHKSIRKKLIELERSLMWLSKKTNINYHGLYSCLIRRHYDITENNLNKINEVLQTDFKISVKN